MIERSLKEQLEVSFVEDSNMDRVIYLFAHMCLSPKLHIVLSSCTQLHGAFVSRRFPFTSSMFLVFKHY